MKKLLHLTIVTFLLTSCNNSADKSFDSNDKNGLDFEESKVASNEKSSKTENKDEQSSISKIESRNQTVNRFTGLDYRPFLGVNKNSDEYVNLLMQYSINPKNKMIRFKESDDIIYNVIFNEECPGDKLPWNSNYFFTEKIVLDKYGEPNLKLKLKGGHYSMIYYYNNPKLAFRFMGYYPPLKDDPERGDTTIVNSPKLAAINIVEMSEISKLLETGQYFKIK